MIAAEPGRMLPIYCSALEVRHLIAGTKRMLLRPHDRALVSLARQDMLVVHEALRIDGVNLKRDRLSFAYAADGESATVRWPSRHRKPIGDVPPARMPLELARWTLRILGVRAMRLQQIEDVDRMALGFDSLGAFAQHWDAQVSADQRWADNPEVLAFTVSHQRRRIAARIPGLGHGGVRR